MKGCYVFPGEDCNWPGDPVPLSSSEMGVFVWRQTPPWRRASWRYFRQIVLIHCYYLTKSTKVRVKVAPWAKFKSLLYNTYQTPNQSRKALDHCSTSRSCYLQHPLSCVAFLFFLRPRRQALLRSGTILCLPQACLFVNKKRRRRGRRSEREVEYRILIALEFYEFQLGISQRYIDQ